MDAIKQTNPLDFKALYRKLEKALDRIERSDEVSKTLSSILESLVSEFREELGFESGRLYQRDGDAFYLCCTAGPAHDAVIGYRVPPDYPAHLRTLSEGLVILHPDDPEFDAEIERAIGVTSTFAAIAVGHDNTHIIAFSIQGDIKEESILYSLSAVRHVINLKLEQQKLTGILEESRIIQESLLPSGKPHLERYDIDGRSRACEVVGGDLFDYLPLSRELLGVVIGDASGHGLPAALLARDVISGLRVGIGEEFKVVKVMERLNRLIHRANLSSRFISVFYSEIERDGTMIYCNAGHNPPLLWHAGRFTELTIGGLVLGPNPTARYKRGYVHLTPGDFVFMYTDGLVERENRDGEQFGVRRLTGLLAELTNADASQILRSAFEALDTFADGTRPTDDMTAVVVRKL